MRQPAVVPTPVVRRLHTVGEPPGQRRRLRPSTVPRPHVVPLATVSAERDLENLLRDVAAVRALMSRLAG